MELVYQESKVSDDPLHFDPHKAPNILAEFSLVCRDVASVLYGLVYLQIKGKRLQIKCDGIMSVCIRW